MVYVAGRLKIFCGRQGWAQLITASSLYLLVYVTVNKWVVLLILPQLLRLRLYPAITSRFTSSARRGLCFCPLYLFHRHSTGSQACAPCPRNRGERLQRGTGNKEIGQGRVPRKRPKSWCAPPLGVSLGRTIVVENEGCLIFGRAIYARIPTRRLRFALDLAGRFLWKDLSKIQ